MSMFSKEQVVIPSEFRKSLSLTAGSALAIFTEGSTLLLRPVELPAVDAFEILLKDSRKAARSADLRGLPGNSRSRRPNPVRTGINRI